MILMKIKSLIPIHYLVLLNPDSYMSFINYNGKIYPADKRLISADNRSFRYGDGCFETIKVLNEKIINENYHFERLFSSIEILQFEKPLNFTSFFLRKQILALIKKNNHQPFSRVRLMIFRGAGSLFEVSDNFPNYIIESSALDLAQNEFNKDGFVIGIYPDAKKAADRFSPLKNNNFLPYAMGALWVKKNNLNDALILNAQDRIAESTTANIFIVKNGTAITPSLSEAPVSGTMRRYLLKCMREENIPVEESEIKPEDLNEASEIFFTNAGFGIRWVSQLKLQSYNNQLSSFLHNKFIKPLYE